MVKIEAGINAKVVGGKFKVVSSYPETLLPCNSLVDKIKLKKEKTVVVVVHTDDHGETSITEKKIGK